MTPSTRVTTGGRRAEWTRTPGSDMGVVNPPVWRASTHLYPDVASLRSTSPGDAHFFYGRHGGPTQWALAEALNDLEPGAAGTALFPSGVAAIHTALLSVLKPGDELLLTDNSYSPTRSFADGFLKQWGVTARYFDPMVGSDIAALFTEKTRAVMCESPGSLTFEAQDVPAICAAAKAHSGAREIVTLLDNTWATPLFFPAIEKGIDITILAGTKYVVGHSDVMMGCATANARYWSRLHKTAQTLGQVLSPDDASLAMRGLRTMDVRLDRHQQSARDIAKWLAGREEVSRVFHPALPGCPGHDIWKRDFAGSSGLFAIELDCEQEAADRFVDTLELFGIGYSWGGFESLALPIDPRPIRTAAPWQGERPLVRLHIGLEAQADLIADLEAGLAAMHG